VTALPSTNIRIVVVTLLVLGACFLNRELIPAGEGAGYDGVTYASWVEHLTLQSLIDSVSSRGEAQAPPPAIALDRPYARRILPSLVLHYVLTNAGVPATTANVVKAFALLNLVLLLIGVGCWLAAADAFGIGDNGKWLGVVGLIVSYANAKMPFYYPTLTDTAAFAIGSVCLLCYVKRQPVALWVASFAGTFVWPTLAYFGFFLIACPRNDQPADDRGANRLAIGLAAGIAAVTMLAIEIELASGSTISATPVRPVAALRHLSVALVGGYLFFGLRPLLASGDLWRSIHPSRLVSRPSLWAACLLIVASELAVWLIAPATRPTRHLANLFLSAIAQPFVFFLAHVLYFGPLLIFLLMAWPRVCRRAQALGAGAVICLGAALFQSIGSESRHLINFLPFAILLLISTIEDVVATTNRWIVFAVVTVLCSKVWLPMDRTLVFPYVGELQWRDVYVSSRGPWISHTAYLTQLLLVLPVALLFYRWWYLSRRSRGSSVATDSSERPAACQPA
jgi:hypothetical protein